MDLFGLYNVMNENLQQKSNLLATVLEEPKVKRITMGANEGITELILREL